VGWVISAIIGENTFDIEAHKWHIKKANATNRGGNVSDMFKMDR